MGSGISEVVRPRGALDVNRGWSPMTGAPRPRGERRRALGSIVARRAGKLDDAEAEPSRRADRPTAPAIEGRSRVGTPPSRRSWNRRPPKRDVFREARQAGCPTRSFLASNTSSVPIMKLAAETSRPERVLGMHFFNPVPVLALVELVRSIMTSGETVERARGFAEQTLGKTCIDSQDRAGGFVVNALLISLPVGRESACTSRGSLSKEDIDNGMVARLAHTPWAPLSRLVRPDRPRHAGGPWPSRSTRSSGTQPRLPPAFCSPQWWRRGLLGRKSGRGFLRLFGLALVHRHELALPAPRCTPWRGARDLRVLVLDHLEPLRGPA